jgi:hypothetical protein
MKTRTTQVEELFLKIFKVTVLFIMGLALVSVVGLLIFAAVQYTQKPVEPAPAQKAPVKEIKIDGLKNYLIERGKAENSRNDPNKQSVQEKTLSLRYLEQATQLFRLAEEFGRKVGVDVDNRNDTEKSQDLERLRLFMERYADASNLRGEAWVRSMIEFSNKAFEDAQLIELKKENKIKSVVYGLIDYHVQAWDAIETERRNFEQNEENRVATQRTAEALRVGVAKATAITSLAAAGAIFVGFLLLALYLIAAKIETNLRDINDSIKTDAVR